MLISCTSLSEAERKKSFPPVHLSSSSLSSSHPSTSHFKYQKIYRHGLRWNQQQTFWHSRLSCCLGHCLSKYRFQFWLLHFQFNCLPRCLGGIKWWLKCWASATHMGEPYGTLGSWIHLGLALTAADICGNEPVERGYLSNSVSPSLLPFTLCETLSNS